MQGAMEVHCCFIFIFCSRIGEKVFFIKMLLTEAQFVAAIISSTVLALQSTGKAPQKVYCCRLDY